MLSKPIPEMGMTEILQSAFTRYLYLSLRGRMGGEGGGSFTGLCHCPRVTNYDCLEHYSQACFVCDKAVILHVESGIR